MDHAIERSRVNVLVFSDAGKPIFARYENLGHNNIARVCGLLQALMSSVRDHLNAGEIRSLAWSGYNGNNVSLNMVFLSMGALTLVAVDDSGTHTEMYLQLQLEYVYSQIIFSVTERIQNIYQSNASFDLCSFLENDQISIQRLLDSTEHVSTFPLFLTAGIPTVFPLSPESRALSTSVLKRIGEDTDNIVFGMLFAGADLKLITLIQFSNQLHPIHSSDVILLMHFLNQQKNSLQSSELWLPVCLPRFHSTGFLHCYAHCLDSDTQLTLVLVSQKDTTDQFQHFRNAATRINRDLVVSKYCNNVLETSDNDDCLKQNTYSTDVSLKRGTNMHEEDSDHVSVNVVDKDEDDDYEIVDHDVASLSSGSSLFIEELHSVVADQNAISMNSRMQKYMDTGMIHFVFRKNAKIHTSVQRKNKKEAEKQSSRLAQCVFANFPSGEEVLKRSILSNYQKLQQRLRLGYSWSTDLSNEATNAQSNMSQLAHQDTVSNFCPATRFSGSSADFQRVVYAVQNGKTFIALNGQDHELYFTMDGFVTVKDAAALGAKLMHKLVADDDFLFLSR